MNEIVKTKWLQALRSGEYKQAVEKLRTGDRYCCLGVLCDLHQQETGTAWDGNRYLGNSDVLPTDVVVWAGLEDENPDISYISDDEEFEAVIADLNDGGFTFEQLAYLIEQQL